MDAREISSVSNGAGMKICTFNNTTPDEPTLPNTRSTINSPGCYNHPSTEAEEDKPRAAHLNIFFERTIGYIVKRCCSHVLSGLHSNSPRTWPPGPCQHLPEERLKGNSMTRIQHESVLAQGKSDPFSTCQTGHILVSVPSWCLRLCDATLGRFHWKMQATQD